MSLVTYLYECGSPSGYGKDCLTLKVEDFSVAVKRSPIIIPIPFGYIVGIDLGTNSSTINLSGVIDYSVTELPVNNVSGYSAGGTVYGSAAWNVLTSPVRSARPSAHIVAVASNSLIVDNVTSFFVDKEPLSGGSTVNRPFPSKQRLEQAIRYWPYNHQLSLYARDTLYQGYFTNAEFDLVAGRNDRFQFRLAFAEATQHLTEASGRPPVCGPCTFLNIGMNRCVTCDLNDDGVVDLLDFIIGKVKEVDGVWTSEQYNLFEEAWFDCAF